MLIYNINAKVTVFSARKYINYKTCPFEIWSEYSWTSWPMNPPARGTIFFGPSGPRQEFF